MFHDYLQDIKDRFTFFSYNMISNNCNHFTNECAGFLVDTQIPEDILNQAKDFFETPLGLTIKPFVVSAQDMLKRGTSSMFDTGSATDLSSNVDKGQLLDNLSQLRDNLGEEGTECLSKLLFIFIKK